MKAFEIFYRVFLVLKNMSNFVVKDWLQNEEGVDRYFHFQLVAQLLRFKKKCITNYLPWLMNLIDQALRPSFRKACDALYLQMLASEMHMFSLCSFKFFLYIFLHNCCMRLTLFMSFFFIDCFRSPFVFPVCAGPDNTQPRPEEDRHYWQFAPGDETKRLDRIGSDGIRIDSSLLDTDQ